MDMNTAPPGFIPDQQGQTGLSPPMMVISQQQAAGAGNHYGTGGHVGPVIGVLAVIAVLGILAGLFGRLCSGRTVFGYGPNFDIESWVETKCSSCLDGHVAPPRHLAPPMHTHMAMESLPTIAAAAGWRPPENVFMRQHSQFSERHPHPHPRQQELEQQHTAVHMRPENVSTRQHSQSSERHPRHQEQQHTGVYLRPENVSMPQHSQSSDRHSRHQEQQHTGVHLRADKVPMRQHSQSDRQPHGLHEEVLLHPLPTRRVPMGNVSDSAAVDRPEPEITSARDQEDQIHQAVDGGLEDDDDLSDSSGHESHDDEHHHHHHEDEEEEQQHHFRHQQN